MNAHATAEPISLRGDYPALALSPGEAEAYTAEEGAFYGQVFTTDDEPINWIACRGQGQAAGEFGGLVVRDCAEPDLLNDPTRTQCGFKYAGDCADFTPVFPSEYACKKFDTDGFYAQCHDQPGLHKWPTAEKFKEVITVFVPAN